MNTFRSSPFIVESIAAAFTEYSEHKIKLAAFAQDSPFAMTGNNFLQIDPNAHFNGQSRHYDDLPENFLETVSPHGSTQQLPLNLQSHHDGPGSHLAALGAMSVSGNEYVVGVVVV